MKATPKTGALKITEAQTLRIVLDYLALRQVPHTRVNTTGAIINRDGQTFFGKRRTGQRGAADILACWKSWPLAFEIKSPVGKQSPDQKEWQAHWTQRGGGLYAVIRDVEQVERILSVL